MIKGLQNIKATSGEILLTLQGLGGGDSTPLPPTFFYIAFELLFRWQWDFVTFPKYY